MFGAPHVTPQVRNVWADEVKRRLVIIRMQHDKLDVEERDLKQTCNHTYPDGRTALECIHYDDGVTDACEVCHS